MKSGGVVLLAAFLLGGLISLMPQASAQDAQDAEKKGPTSDPKKPLETPEVEPKEPANLVEDLAEVRDPSFERFVDLRQLGKALDAQDAAGLADVALALAEGERVLLRSHKAISADKVFKLAIRLATDSKDIATLDRLERAAKAQKKDELSTVIAAARKLAMTSRAPRASLTFTEEQIDSGMYHAYRARSDAIEKAKKLGDRESLNNIAHSLGTGIALDDKLQEVLRKRIAEALKELPEKPDEETAMLLKLRAASRGASGGSGSGPITVPYLPGATNLNPMWAYFPASVGEWYYINTVSISHLPPTNVKLLRYCNLHRGTRVGNGQCADLAVQGLRSATGRYPNIGNGPDYRWGSLVATITPGNLGGASRILPGDILQFRQGYFYHATGGGGYWSYSCGEPDGSVGHTAVVCGLKSNGRIINVDEQNCNLIQIDMHGVYDLNDLKKGTIWAYRP